MKITNEWLLKWQSEKGGYKKRQLILLGIAWPPKRGWKRDVLGLEISDEEARTFETASERAASSELADRETAANITR